MRTINRIGRVGGYLVSMEMVEKKKMEMVDISEILFGASLLLVLLIALI